MLLPRIVFPAPASTRTPGAGRPSEGGGVTFAVMVFPWTSVPVVPRARGPADPAAEQPDARLVVAADYVPVGRGRPADHVARRVQLEHDPGPAAGVGDRGGARRVRPDQVPAEHVVRAVDDVHPA